MPTTKTTNKTKAVARAARPERQVQKRTSSKTKVHPRTASLIPTSFPDVNKRCKEIRLNMEITQVELSGKLGVTLSMIKAVENTVVAPNIYYVIQLSKTSHYSTDYILTGKGSKNITLSKN